MIAGVQSCVKDTSPPINDSVPDIVQNDIIQDDIGQQIQNFIKSMENYDSRSGLRGGSTDGSTAMQDVENAMNYAYGWTGDAYQNYTTQTDTLRVLKSTSSVEMKNDDVKLLYDTVLDKITSNFKDVRYDNKHVMVVDLALVDESSRYLDIGISVVIGDVWVDSGSRGPGTPADWNFLPGEDWGAMGGTCLDENLPSGAPEEIAKHVTYNYGGHGQPVNYYYINTVERPYTGPWNLGCYDEGGMVPLDVPLCSEVPVDEWCIDHLEGNSYTDIVGYQISNEAQSLNKEFVTLSMDSDLWFDGLYLITYSYWEGNAIYGERRYIDRPNYPSDPEF